MTAIAPHLSTFLLDYLPKERRASPQTCETYAYAFQLLISFAANKLGSLPSSLTIEQLDVPMVLAFLDHLERSASASAREAGALTLSASRATVASRFLVMSMSSRTMLCEGDGDQAQPPSPRTTRSRGGGVFGGRTTSFVVFRGVCGTKSAKCARGYGDKKNHPGCALGITSC